MAHFGNGPSSESALLCEVRLIWQRGLTYLTPTCSLTSSMPPFFHSYALHLVSCRFHHAFLPPHFPHHRLLVPLAQGWLLKKQDNLSGGSSGWKNQKQPCVFHSCSCMYYDSGHHLGTVMYRYQGYSRVFLVTFSLWSSGWEQRLSRLTHAQLTGLPRNVEHLCLCMAALT